MYEYVKGNQCLISKENCPFVYWCDKIHAYKPSSSMPENCKIKEKLQIPKGYSKVRFERKGYLYVDVNDQTIQIKNPFDDIPLYVKVTKSKDGNWRIRK